jgi:hypothetical protein
MTRLVPSEPEFVTPVRIATRFSGHQVETVVTNRAISGKSDAAEDS